MSAVNIVYQYNLVWLKTNKVEARIMRKIVHRLSLLMLVTVFAGSVTISAAALPAQKSVSQSLLTTPPPPVPQPILPATATPRPAAFPTVPPGGTPITNDYTYFHPTGLFSIPHFVGFDCSTDDEYVVDHENNRKGYNSSDIGAIFSSCEQHSVLHVYADRNNAAPVTRLADLDVVYDTQQFDFDWERYNGGYTELDRRTTLTRHIVSFELVHNGYHYLARQTTELAGDGWTKTVRVIVPNNNPGLLDTLETKLWEAFNFYNVPSLFSVPLWWHATADAEAGYIIRYPATWSEDDAEPGVFASISGIVNSTPVTLQILVASGKQIINETDARAWVTALHARSTVRLVRSDSRGDKDRWLVSYNDPDGPFSAVAVLINGKNGSLYSADYALEVSGVDILDKSAWLPTLTMSWDTFTFLDAQTPIATATRKP